MNQASYDPTADCAYICLTEGHERPTRVAYSKELGKHVVLDYDGEHRLIGVELIGVLDLPAPHLDDADEDD